MSRQIPKNELNNKFSYRLKQWFLGEADTYVDILESAPQKEARLDEKTVKSHQEDQQHLLEQIHDTKKLNRIN